MYLYPSLVGWSRDTEFHMSAAVRQGRYVYLEDLLAFQNCRAVVPVRVPGEMEGIVSPLHMRVRRWEEVLMAHPDGLFFHYICTGLTRGFRVGYEYRAHRCRPARRNMGSVVGHQAFIESYLQKEVSLGRVRGPVRQGLQLPAVQVSPLGVIPKSTPGEWRLIVDMSSPEGMSVNDGISSRRASLAYVSIDNLAEVVCGLGPGTQLAKFDLKSAYRLVPVFPEDRLLLGIRWRDSVFVDTVLPFGMRSAPKLFNAVADALQWIIRSRGPRFVFHYLDDFALVGAPNSDECRAAFKIARGMCDWLGVPWAEDKTAEPSTCMTFLGVELDTQTMQMRLPQKKLARLVQLVEKWRGRSAATKRDLQSLAGHLQHASKVVKPGRCFLRRIYELESVARSPDRYLRLNKALRCDLQWWNLLLTHWNGVSLLETHKRKEPDLHVFSDAAGWGCGAVWGEEWLQHEWEEPIRESSITLRELIPIVVAAAVWGERWAGMVVCFHCDNEGVVADLNRLYSSDAGIMHLLRCLFLFAALRSFWFCARHVPGRDNVVADAISRDKREVVMAFFPQGGECRMPPSLPRLLYLDTPDWTSTHWIGQLSCFLGRP